MPEGAEDGPGLKAGSESSSGTGRCKLPAPTDSAAERGPDSVDLDENGPGHSLRADPGVIGERPRLSGSRPPRAKLERNS